jgi:hypothetical protein
MRLANSSVVRRSLRSRPVFRYRVWWKNHSSFSFRPSLTGLVVCDVGACSACWGATEPSSFLPVRGPDLRSACCVYIEGYTRYPTGTAAAAESALLVTSPPVLEATTWPATVVNGSETQYHDVTSRTPSLSDALLMPICRETDRQKPAPPPHQAAAEPGPRGGLLLLPAETTAGCGLPPWLAGEAAGVRGAGGRRGALLCG